MKISISIVTYNSLGEIDDVLSSVAKTVCGDEITVYVVDNASSDGTAQYIEANYPQIKLIRSPKNVGYGAGHNIAIRQVDSDVHFVINPDIRFGEDFIANAAEYVFNNKDIALMTPGVVGYDGRINVVPRRLPSIRRLAGSFLGKKSGLLGKWNDDYYMADAGDKTEPFDIQISSGCIMVMDTKTLQSENGFDESFFLYFEDFDLSRRMNRHGRIVCNPQLTVYHEGKRDGHKSLKSFKMLFFSMVRYFNKWGWKL